MSKKLVGITLTSCLVVSITGIAGSLQQKEGHKYSEEMVKGELPEVEKKCDVKMTAEFDWSGFDKLTPDAQGGLGFQPGQFGRECLQGIERMCGNADAKAAVKDKVKKLVIKYGGEGKRSFALASGTLSYTIDPKKGTSDASCREYLVKTL